MESPTIQVDIPESQIADVETFESLYRDGMAEATTPDERATSMADLAEATSMKDGSRLIDAAILRIDAEAGAKQSDAELAEARERLVRVRLAADTKKFAGLNLVETVPQDVDATAAAQRMAAKVGYGPKQNDSSRGSQTHLN